MNAKELGSQPAYAGAADYVLIDKNGVEGPVKVEYRTSGLTKRELFAAMAMQGFAADSMNVSANIKSMANDAVEWADALLAELAKDQP